MLDQGGGCLPGGAWGAPGGDAACCPAEASGAGIHVLGGGVGSGEDRFDFDGGGFLRDRVDARPAVGVQAAPG